MWSFDRYRSTGIDYGFHLFIVDDAVFTMGEKPDFLPRRTGDDQKIDQDLDFFGDEALETYPNMLLHNDPFYHNICTQRRP